MGSGNFTSVGSTVNAAGYNLDTGGVTVGLEYKFAANFVVGIDGGYANTSARLVNGGKVDVDGGQFGIFASYFDMDFYIDAAVHVGTAGYKTRRTALGGVATANPGGSSTSVLVAGGYDWKFGGLTVGPTASFQYTNTSLDSFTETGSLAPLTVQSHDGESSRTALGVRALYDANVWGILLRPELRAAWQHEYSDTSSALTANFASLGGSAFTVSGPQIGRDSLLIGAGVTMVWSSVLSTFIAYDGEVGRSNYDSHSVSGGVRFKF
jgi:outer membrane autotransporter protein